MVKIMRCILGKDFGYPDFKIKFDSPYRPDIIAITLNEVEIPFPSRSFDPEEVKDIRDYLTGILDEHERITADLANINP